MSRYYIVRPSNGDIYQLDSTSEVVHETSGSLTTTPVETGVEVSDHYINNNDVIRFQGIISSAKSNATVGAVGSLHPVNFIDNLLKMKDTKEPFTLYHISEGKGSPNCLFTSLVFSQDKTNGVRGRASSVKVSFTAQQIRFAEQATIISKATKVEVKDSHSEEVSGAGLTAQKELNNKESLLAAKAGAVAEKKQLSQ